jgi:hypothetical protein
MLPYWDSVFAHLLVFQSKHDVSESGHFSRPVNGGEPPSLVGSVRERDLNNWSQWVLLSFTGG